MKVKDIIVEDFVNYKLPSLFIATTSCDFKCCKEAHVPISVCQNSSLCDSEIKSFPNSVIYNYFITNPITKAIVVGGMEPVLQIEEIIDLIDLFRSKGDKSYFVIYTGYYPNEIKNELTKLKQYDNIIVKFGRFIPNQPSRYDEILGVTLASNNQYAEVIS